MRVGILTEPMLFQHPGPRASQVRQLLAAFQRMPANPVYGAVDASLVDPARENLDDYDLIHVVGAAHGNHAAVASAAACAVPVVLSAQFDGCWTRAEVLLARASAALLARLGSANAGSRYAEQGAALRHATLIVADSAAERAMIAAAFRIDPAKVRIVPEGIASHWFDADPALCRQRCGLHGEFALLGGAIGPAGPTAEQCDIARTLSDMALPLVVTMAAATAPASAAAGHASPGAATIAGAGASTIAGAGAATIPDAGAATVAGAGAAAIGGAAVPHAPDRRPANAERTALSALRAIPGVTILGAMEDQPRLLASIHAAAAVCILPRRADPNGALVRSAMHALAAGTPILADRDGVAELPDSDYAVRRIQSMNRRARQSAILRLIDTPPQPERLRALVRERSWDHIATRLLHCYADAITLQGPALNVFTGTRSPRQRLARSAGQR